MTSQADIAVFGNGITAHTTALLMADLGLRVQVSATRKCSSTAHAARDIRAYAISHTSRATLALAGAWPISGDAPWLTPVTHMRVFGDGAGHLNLDGQGEQPVAWMVDVAALEDKLAQLVSAHSDIAQVPAGIELRGTLNVLCEGKLSAGRAGLGIEVSSTAYPHRALAARLRSPQPHGGVAQQWFNGSSILALLPVGGSNGCELAMVWSMPHEQCDHWVAQAQTTHGCAALVQAISAMSRHTFYNLELLDEPVAFALSLSKAKQWVQHGMALVGDSAHTIHPLAGLGLNMGLADVQALVEVIGNRQKSQSVSDMRLLRRYQRIRACDTTKLQLATHGLFHLFTQPWANTQVVQTLRNWGMLGVDMATPLKRWIQSHGMNQIR